MGILPPQCAMQLHVVKFEGTNGIRKLSGGKIIDFYSVDDFFDFGFFSGWMERLEVGGT